jgi:hypothetical protein
MSLYLRHFFNECLEGIGKRKLTDGKAENTYASYYRSSFNDDYAEAFSYNFGTRPKALNSEIEEPMPVPIAIPPSSME